MIETKIPQEIKDYEEKIIFGLSGRQLICSASAIALAIGSYYLCKKIFGLSLDATSYVIIAEAFPFMALGFLRKDGQPFEKYFILLLRQRIGQNRITYVTKIDGGNDDAWATKKYVAKRTQSRKSEQTEHYCINRKQQRRKTNARIRAAQKEYQAAKQCTTEKN